MEEGDLTEEEEDDEDGIRFVTLESRFENKETVLKGHCHTIWQLYKRLEVAFASIKFKN